MSLSAPTARLTTSREDDGFAFGELRIQPAGAQARGAQARGEAILLPLSDARRQEDDIALFSGGCVREQDEYQLSLDVRSSRRVRGAWMSVNGSDRIACSIARPGDVARDDSETSSRAEATPASDTTRIVAARDARDFRTTCPFSLTCGLARVEVCVMLADGTSHLLTSDDIVATSAPGAEEGNIRAMFDALLSCEGNQAAEWMLSATPEEDPANDRPETGPRSGASCATPEEDPANDRPSDNDTSPLPSEGTELSDDEETDWSARSLARSLDVVGEALAIFHAGVLDDTDAFPTSQIAPDGTLTHDTPENRIVLAFLGRLDGDLASIRRQLEEDANRSRALCRSIEFVAQAAGAAASVPVTELVRERVEQSEGYLRRVRELMDRSQLAHRSMASAAPDARAVSGELTLPAFTGIWKDDETYRRMWHAIRSWLSLGSFSFTREQRALHTVKPDRLYEYYALWRMLTWLWRNGFSEDRDVRMPITRHAYTPEDQTGLFENEWRCANTYRLADAAGTKVTLYYQPVIYGSAREENGITLHRTVAPRPLKQAASPSRTSFYTPDYLLLIRNEAMGLRRFVPVDAKYFSAQRVAGLGKSDALESTFETVQRKYLQECRDSMTGRPADAVWIVCGRGAEEEILQRQTAWAAEAGLPPSGIVKIGPSTSWDAVGEFMGCLVPSTHRSG